MKKVIFILFLVVFFLKTGAPTQKKTPINVGRLAII